MILVNADIFRAVSIARSDEETRYYLKGVFVQPHPHGGAVLTATDGHILVSAYDLSGVCDTPAIIGLDRVRLAACKSKPRFGARYVRCADGALVEIVSGAEPDATVYETQPKAVIDGTFPDWPRVIPREPYGPTAAGFNADLLGRVAEASQILRGSKDPDVKLLAGADGDEGPLFVPISDTAFGVVMPKRKREGVLALELPAFVGALRG